MSAPMRSSMSRGLWASGGFSRINRNASFRRVPRSGSMGPEGRPASDRSGPEERVRSAIDDGVRVTILDGAEAGSQVRLQRYLLRTVR
jgi:hypothetical protein